MSKFFFFGFFILADFDWFNEFNLIVDLTFEWLDFLVEVQRGGRANGEGELAFSLCQIRHFSPSFDFVSSDPSKLTIGRLKVGLI